MVLEASDPDECTIFDHLLHRVYYSDKPGLRFHLVTQIIKQADQIRNEEIAIRTIKSIDIDFIALLIQSNGILTLIGLQLVQIFTQYSLCVKILDSIRPLIVSALTELIDQADNKCDDGQLIREDLIINGIDALVAFFTNLSYSKFCDLNNFYESREEIIPILFPDESSSGSIDKKCPYCKSDLELDHPNELDKLLDSKDEYEDLEAKWERETFEDVLHEGDDIDDTDVISVVTRISEYILNLESSQFNNTIKNCSLLLSIGNVELSRKCIAHLLKNDVGLAISALQRIFNKKEASTIHYKQYINALLTTKLDRKSTYKFFSILSENSSLLTEIEEVKLLSKRAHIEIFVTIEDIIRNSKLEEGQFDLFFVSCIVIENSMIYLDRLENDVNERDEGKTPIEAQDELIDKMSTVASGNFSKSAMSKIHQLFQIFHETVQTFFDYYKFLDEKYSKIAGYKKKISSCGVRVVGCWMYLEPTHLRIEFKRTIKAICAIVDWTDFLWLLPAFESFESHEICDHPYLLNKLFQSYYHLCTAKDSVLSALSMDSKDVVVKLCLLISRIYLDTLVEPGSLLFKIDNIIDKERLDGIYQAVLAAIDVKEDGECGPGYSAVALGKFFYENPLEYIPIPYSHINGDYRNLYQDLTKLVVASTLSNLSSSSISLLSSTCLSVVMSRDDSVCIIPDDCKRFLYTRTCRGLLDSDTNVFLSCLNTSIVMSNKCSKFKHILDTTLYNKSLSVDSPSISKLISYIDTITS